MVLIVEREKDADNLAALGLLATTNSCGAEKWTADLNQHFKNRVRLYGRASKYPLESRRSRCRPSPAAAFSLLVFADFRAFFCNARTQNRPKPQQL